MENFTFHAFIVSGTDEDALQLAAALVCDLGGAEPCGECPQCRKSLRGVHPDIEKILPSDDKKQIPVRQVREIVHAAYIAPNDAQARVLYFDEADETLSTAAQNSLLKLLEEPPEYLRIILRAHPGSLLPTVRSRCRIIMRPVQLPDARQDISDYADRFFAAAFAGATELLRYSFELEKIPRADLPALFAEMRRRVAELHKSVASGGNAQRTVQQFLPELPRLLDEAEEYFKYNLSVQHITAKLCAGLV